MVSEKTIGRLSLYRRLLSGLAVEQRQSIYSRELATLAGGTAPQVRRDLMSIGYSGSPSKGYVISDLIDSINNFMDNPDSTRAAVIGAGNLGRAILAYFEDRRPKLKIVAAFDNDPNKTGSDVCNCPCYDIANIKKIVKKLDISLGVITVPADTAQEVGNKLVDAGVMGILNFAPIRLQLPDNVYVERVDLTMSAEKVAYFVQANND
ncbi:MAG: redox-sensing transcriptional repressor Rex [bacterium]|nr:redox-sensing transcriptional repressor Rex [bacterium]